MTRRLCWGWLHPVSVKRYRVSRVILLNDRRRRALAEEVCIWITIFQRRCTGCVVLSRYSVATVQSKTILINRSELWKISQTRKVNKATVTARRTHRPPHKPTRSHGLKGAYWMPSVTRYAKARRTQRRTADLRRPASRGEHTAAPLGQQSVRKKRRFQVT